MSSCGGENVAMQQEWSFPVPIDQPVMWSEPATNEGLHLRVLCYVEGEFVKARIALGSEQAC